MSKCKFCQAPIVWLKDEDDNNIPVEPNSTYPGNKKFNPVANLDHRTVCKKQPPRRKPGHRR